MKGVSATLDTFEKAFSYLQKHGELPEHFRGYGLVNSGGWAIAHMAVMLAELPDWFEDWGLCVCRGRTVAHLAARKGRLPKRFNKWHLADHDRITVIQMFAQCGMKNWPERSALFGMKMRPDLELTVADFILGPLYRELKGTHPELMAEVRAWKVAEEIQRGAVEGATKLKRPSYFDR